MLCVLIRSFVDVSSLSENIYYNPDGCPLGPDAWRLNVTSCVVSNLSSIQTQKQSAIGFPMCVDFFLNRSWLKCCEEMFKLCQKCIGSTWFCIYQEQFRKFCLFSKCLLCTHISFLGCSCHGYLFKRGFRADSG